MFTVQLTESFQSWLDGLRDIRAQVSIARRIARMAEGNLGDVKPVGDGVSELRVDLGPGYRVYFVQRGGHLVVVLVQEMENHRQDLVVVLAGGNKSTQTRDIQRAKQLAKEI